MEPSGAESLTCAGCLNYLDDEDYISALGNDWHTECFRCSACDVALSSWYFEKDGLLFCQDDYWARYGESCQQCSQVITGPVMVAGEHRFHPECFACASCRAFIGDGEAYALLERSKLYWYDGGCYKNFMQPLGRGRSAHSIRIVEMPPTSGGGNNPQIRLAAGDKRGPITADYACRGVTIQDLGAKLSMLIRGLLRTILSLCIQLTCHRMDSSCGLMTLHIGDRILEINGTPIRSQPVEEIERVLCCSDTVLQLTIEHDPDNAGFKPYQRCKLSIDEPKTTKHASDTKSRIERKQMKRVEDKKQCIPLKHSAEAHSKVEPTRDINSNHRQSDEVDRSPETSDPVELGREVEEQESGGRVKERLFKRKGDGQNSKGRVIRRRQAPDSPMLEKERSSSMSKLLDTVGTEEVSGVLCDLSRARSFRVEPASNQRVFRGCDLLQGELLGCGFFGQVYKVTHRDTGEVMVLKQLYRVDEDAQKNFLKEVAVLRSLNHGNVLRFIGVLYKDKRLHLVTEYVAGGTLQQLLQDASAALCWAVRARLARDIAAGVGYLHRMNVIHRDLNSHNCLVREDKTVIVADFGLARIVQRTASSSMERPTRSSTLNRRKRYTVVGNPYWMAPEMMKGNVYDEKVDVFSFGIILCEIIGRVQADPDFLPRRSDFGLNEPVFREKFCQGCPEPFCRLAFLCCDLNPDNRPPFEVIEIWLQSLMMHLSVPGPLPGDLLADILRYQHGTLTHCGHSTPECSPHDETTLFCCKTTASRRHDDETTGNDDSTAVGSCQHCNARDVTAVGSKDCQYCNADGNVKVTAVKECCQHKAGPEVMDVEGMTRDEPNSVAVLKSKSNAKMLDPQVSIRVEECPERQGRALGKCVSAGQICPSQNPVVTISKLSKSQNTLVNAPPGYILRADGRNINITRVDDISEWVDPPTPLKRSSPDLPQKNAKPTTKTRKIEKCQRDFDDQHLPSFLRNQSVEGLESEFKNDVGFPQTFCRHTSIPDNCAEVQNNSDPSDESDSDMCTWYQRVNAEKSLKTKTGDAPKLVVDIVKNGKKFLHDENVELRHPPAPGTNERKIIEQDSKRYNIDHLNKSPCVTETIKNIQKQFNRPPEKPEKTNFFTKTLLSPKLPRLFRPHTAEVDRKKPVEIKSPKMLSKFFVQRPSSPSFCRSSYRVRPVDDLKREQSDPKIINDSVLESDIKLASLGKPMTPIFRRHSPLENGKFQDGRYSCRDRRSAKVDAKLEAKRFPEIRRSRVVVPESVKRIETKLSPLSRCTNIGNIPAMATAPEAKIKCSSDASQTKIPKDVIDKIDGPKKKESGILRNNYVSLANLKINCRPKELDGGDVTKNSTTVVPVERFI